MRIARPTTPESWDEIPARTERDDTFVVDVGGFEGPLDLLLDLARRQKVDLHEISVLALAEQYLAFVEAARALRLELAADYLVMAAWLAFLKSRLLLPEPPKPDEPGAGELAAALAERLRRLEAIRAAARSLGERPLLGRDVFAGGFRADPLPAHVEPPPFAATIHDLLAAYAGSRRRDREIPTVRIRRRVWTLAEARAVLEVLVGEVGDWFALEDVLGRFMAGPEDRAGVTASLLAASLELAREGAASLHQEAPFGPLRVGPARMAA